MSQKTKIVVLGTDDHLKKNLMSVILGKDVFAHRISDVKIEKHDNDTYEVMFTPKLYKASEDIRKLFSSGRHPEFCLLVVEDGFKTHEVWHQIENLHKITDRPTEEFRVVLPLRCKPEEYPFKFYTLDDLFKELRKPAEHGNPMLTQERSAEPAHTQTSGAARIPGLGSFTDIKKSSKGSQSDNKVNLVLLGMYGTGKSASGNTILGWRQFESKASSMPVTTECQVEGIEIDGTYVHVIDTPDMFDDEIKSSDKNHHVTLCRQLCQSGPCVYLLVMQVGRFTDGERDILRKVEEAFGPKAKEQTILLFTRGEELQRAKMSFEAFLQACEPELKKIVKQCGRRCVLFENQTSGQPQVTELMQTVNMMLNKQNQ